MNIETFLNQYQLSLAEDKLELFNTDSCPKLIKGLSGSGKSTLMLCRSAYLIEEGYKNTEILNLMINKEAVKSCEKQYKQLFEELACPKMTDIYSFAYSVLKAYANRHRKQVRKAYKELTPLIARLCKDFFHLVITKEQAFVLASEISQYRNAGAEAKTMASSVEGVDLKLLADEYKAMKARKEVLDYDDILWDCVEVLRQDEKLLKDLQSQYRILHVDDAQDYVYAAHVILNMMKGSSELVYYADFESASQPLESDHVLMNFDKVYPEHKIVTLEGHYRCPSEVWKKACEFKKLEGTEVPESAESEIKFKNFADLSRLYMYAESKVDDVETAFLYRHYAMAMPLVERLQSKEIPVQFNGNVKYFIQDKIVTDLWNYIELLIDPRDMRAFYEVYRLLGLDVSKRVLVEISDRMKNEEHVDVYHALMESGMKAVMKQRLASMIENIRIAETLSSEDMISFIIEKLDYGLYLRMMNRSLQDPVILAMLAIARRYPKPDEFLYRLSELKNFKSTPDSNICIAPVDALKGLSFERVCFLDCIKNIMPRRESAVERNNFYHAMTRTRKELEFFTAKQVGENRLYASPYLFEIHGKNNTAENKTEVVQKRKVRMADLKAGVRIMHVNFGEGIIKKVNVSMIQIQFKEEVKVLNTKICIQNQWLTLL